MGERRVAYMALVGKAEGNIHLESLGVDGMIFKNLERGMESG
jgi:hypothetical protein